MKPPLSPSLRRRSRGLTLVELGVVLAVVALLSTIALPGLQSLADGSRLAGAATQLGADLRLVRAEAVARNMPLRLTVFADAAGSCYLLHTGNANDCQCASTGAARCRAPAEAVKTTQWTTADRVSLASNARSLLFDPVHGTTSPTATLRITGVGGREVRHVVNVMGRVRSCSPAPAVHGYAPC